jgi:hypothetical protein
MFRPQETLEFRLSQFLARWRLGEALTPTERWTGPGCGKKDVSIETSFRRRLMKQPLDSLLEDVGQATQANGAAIGSSKGQTALFQAYDVGSGYVRQKRGRPMTGAREIALALGGDVVSFNRVAAPGPGHSPKDRSLSVLITGSDFIVHSFAGDDWRVCKDYVRARLGQPASDHRHRS